MSGHTQCSSLELAQENRKKERKKETLTNAYFLNTESDLVLAYTIELMDDLGLVR